MVRFNKLAAVALGVAGLASAGMAHATQVVDIAIKGETGPYAVCIGSMESAEVLSGFVTQNDTAIIALPADGTFLAPNEAGIVVTGPNGTVRVRPERGAASVTVDMRKARPVSTRCDPELSVNAKEATAAYFEHVAKHLEKGAETEKSADDTNLAIKMLPLMEAETMQAFEVAGIERVINGSVYDAIAEDFKQREDRRKAQETIERIMAAFAARAEQIQQERDAAAAERRHKEEERERERLREEAIAAAAEAEPKGEACFGAIGQGCSRLRITTGGIKGSSCKDNGNRRDLCWVNTGSWLHDECCVAHPNGVMCGGNDSSPKCQASWDHAVGHASGIIWSWQREVDPRKLNDTGRVNFNDYCAPNGQALAPNDGDRYCCSGRSASYQFSLFFVMLRTDVCKPKLG